jgi:hypothetical protein
MPGRVRNF